MLRIRDAVQWWCLPGPLKPRKRARPPITDGRRSAAREAVLRNTLASPLAAVSLALPGQTAPSRHHHCPAHWAAEPPRVRPTVSDQPPGTLQKGSAPAMTRGGGIYPVSGSVFCPSGTLENRTFDREPPGTGSRRSRKGRAQTRDPDGGPQPHTGIPRWRGRPLSVEVGKHLTPVLAGQRVTLGQALKHLQQRRASHPVLVITVVAQ